MNLPNKLTMLRILLVPVFVILLLSGYKWLALSVFIVASLTDLLDGWIARKYNMVTTFGKFADPLADKLLVLAGLVCFVELKRIPAWFVVVIFSRDLIISGLRMVAAEKKMTIAASYFGKVKTVAQMVLVMLLTMNLSELEIFTGCVFWATLVFTVLSGVDYMIKHFSAVLSDM